MMAERGVVVPSETGPRVGMESGNRQEVERGTGRFSLLYFDRYTIELNEFGEMTQSRWREPKERFLSELLWPADDERDRRYRQELIAEGHQRLVAPMYTVVFALIGVAALLARKSVGEGRRVSVRV